MRITTTYDRIELSIRKTFICTVCGKRGARRRTFGQTINPFNKDAQGRPKTVDQIERELNRQCADWQPTMHERCELSTLPPELQ